MVQVERMENPRGIDIMIKDKILLVAVFIALYISTEICQST